MSKTMEEDVEAQQVESSKHLLEKHSGRRGKREDDDFKKGFKGSNRTVREQVLLFWTRLSTRGRFSLGLFTVLMCTLLVLAVRDQHAKASCVYSEYGWVATADHAYGKILKPRMNWLPRRGNCQKFVTHHGSGFCLCNLTSIALPSEFGHGPIRCEDACKNHRIEGKPLPKCSLKHSTKPCQEKFAQKSKTAVQTLYKAFKDARGSQKKIGVTLPGFRNANVDFVWEGKRLSDEDVQKIVRKIESYKSKQPREPIGLFKGRGIALVGGNRQYQTPFWVAVHAIRRTGCTLPIEIWFPHKELPSCHRIAELGKLDVTVRSFSELANQNPGDQDFELHSFMYKIFALVFSSFEEVLLLDSDIVAVKDPEFLFDAPEYKDHGTLLWKDFWNSSSAPDCQRILGERTALSFTHESGQMLVHKSRKWDALMLALYMNSFPKFFYPLSVNYMGWGDKEILAFAILSLGEDYGIVEDGPDHVGVLSYMRPGVIGNTMMQHDPSGLPLFMHANLGKMSTHLPYKERFYKRRWQISLVHGEGLIDVVAEHAGVDLEMWIYDLIVSNRCLFDSNEFQGLPKRQLGMAITDHPNLNNDITAVKVLESEGYLMYQEATLSPDTVLLRDKLADFAAEWE